jgi:hypothetical protein
MPIENIETFDALDWVNNYFDGLVPVDFDQLRPVLCFSLVWNLFETVACGKYATPAAIRKSVDKADQAGLLREGKYQRYVEFFRGRYLHYQNLDYVFDQLLLREQESRVIVGRVLRGETRDLNNTVYALLIIALRIRNNLFHGNKEVAVLYRQRDLFTVVNSLLADYIDDIK